MPTFSDLFSAVAESAKEYEEAREKPVNASFPSKEEVYAYFRKVAGLRPGDLVKYKTTDGVREGIFITFDSEGWPTIYSWKDNKVTGKGISPICLVFDDMPAEQPQPDPETEDEDCELENFPRT